MRPLYPLLNSRWILGCVYSFCPLISHPQSRSLPHRIVGLCGRSPGPVIVTTGVYLPTPPKHKHIFHVIQVFMHGTWSCIYN